jgi:hypothetical protein
VTGVADIGVRIYPRIITNGVSRLQTTQYIWNCKN